MTEIKHTVYGRKIGPKVTKFLASASFQVQGQISGKTGRQRYSYLQKRHVQCTELFSISFPLNNLTSFRLIYYFVSVCVYANDRTVTRFHLLFFRPNVFRPTFLYRLGMSFALIACVHQQPF